MNEGPRRRRPSEVRTTAAPVRGAFPLFPLLIVVVLAGFGLGALLSHQFAKTSTTTTTTAQSGTVATAPTTEPSQAPSPAATQSASPSQSPSPAASPSSKPSPHASPHRVALVTPSPQPSASSGASAQPKPNDTAAPTAASPTAPARTPAPQTPKPATPKPATPKPATARPATPKPATPKPAPAAPVGPAATAAATARTYLDALIRGDYATANTALGRGPDQTDFPEREAIDRSSHITDVHTLSNGDGTYKVEIEVAGGKGTFFCTFQAARNEASAFYLSDHYCVRIQ